MKGHPILRGAATHKLTTNDVEDSIGTPVLVYNFEKIWIKLDFFFLGVLLNRFFFCRIHSPDVFCRIENFLFIDLLYFLIYELPVTFSIFFLMGMFFSSSL